VIPKLGYPVFGPDHAPAKKGLSQEHAKSGLDRTNGLCGRKTR
jgi:hypothetical protein